MTNPLIINNIEFALSQQNACAEVSLIDLPRLIALLLPNEQGDIRYTLTGSAKQFSRPSLRLVVIATLPVTCQRCLDAMRIDLALDLDYLISEDNEPEECQQNDALDWLEAAQEMNVVELIEDELLMAMPIAPTHASLCQAYTLQSGVKPNPFAVLKGFIK